MNIKPYHVENLNEKRVLANVLITDKLVVYDQKLSICYFFFFIYMYNVFMLVQYNSYNYVLNKYHAFCPIFFSISVYFLIRIYFNKNIIIMMLSITFVDVKKKKK